MDSSISLFLNSLVGQSPLLDGLIVFCASYLAYVLGALFIIFLMVAAHERREKWELFFTGFIAALIARGGITEGIRFFYHRPRPFLDLSLHPLITENSWSFPSGHATFFFAVSTAIYLYNRTWGRVFFGATILMTLARVIAGVHYLSDIVGGAIIGVGTAYFVHLCIRRLWPKVAH